jgi:thiamine-phosphate pyrophosphorylase
MPHRNIRDRRLYCIIDLDSAHLSNDPVYIARELVVSGARIIQLRSKMSSVGGIIDIGSKIQRITKKKDAIFIINDRVDIAIAIDADGVHLGQEDLPVKAARKILGKDKIIGFSTHSFFQARLAQDYPVDYISVGPVFKSPTKPELKPIGIEMLRRITKMSRKDVVAIGGINLYNLEDVLSSGVNSVAMVSAVLSYKNPGARVRVFRERINNYEKTSAGK